MCQTVPMDPILIIDDDLDVSAMLSSVLAASGFTAIVAASLQEARQHLMLMPVRAIFVDLNLPDGSGLSLYDDPRLIGQAPIVLITGHASLDTSIKALRLGVVDYLIKPVRIEQLQHVLNRLASPALAVPSARPPGEAAASGAFPGLIAVSHAMRQVCEQITRVAPTVASVLLVGESGTGKEVVAQTIHAASARRDGPFLAVNCGAISPQLIESELFGHEKGSFTGANRQHRGFFERAHNGTLFLDEVTEMPLDLQVKLLRVLETGIFARVGSEEPMRTDIRLLAATNRDPLQAMEQGRLREDLYYRLDVFRIQLPALRMRVDDIEPLALSFLAAFSPPEAEPFSLSPNALDSLRRYHWPGNVRQLRNVVQRAAIMSDQPRIESIQLPGSPDLPPVSMHAEGADRINLPIGTSIADAERALIQATLQHCGGVRERAAETLGISLKTLYNRLRDYERSSQQPSA